MASARQEHGKVHPQSFCSPSGIAPAAARGSIAHVVRTGGVDDPLLGMYGRISNMGNIDARWTVALFLLLLPDHWVKTTRGSRFDQQGMLTHFLAPDIAGGTEVPHFEQQFQSREKPPSSAITKAFWGPRVFEFMLKRLNEQLETQRQLGTMHAFRLMRPECGIVFSDGTKPTQRRAAVANEPCCSWWPVLFVHSPYNKENTFVCWCQAAEGGRQS